MSDAHDIFVTPRGRDLLMRRIEEKRRHHQDICAEREAAYELSGDGWHDNPHFNHLQQLEAIATREVAELEALLRRAKMFLPRDGARPTERVGLGSVVTVLIVNEGDESSVERTFEVVGYQESHVEVGRLAYDVPLAARVMGLESGDSARMRLPGGRQVRVEVVDLHEDASMLGDREA